MSPRISLSLEGSLAQTYTGTPLVPTTKLVAKRNSSVPWFLNVNKFYSDFRAISKWMVARNDFGHGMATGRKGETWTGIGIPRPFVKSATL